MYAAEYDYLAAGGDPSIIVDDASVFSGQTSTVATITETTPAPTVLGVIAVTSAVPQSQNGPTAITFEVYLTAAEATDTVVDYAVTAPNAKDLSAAAFGGMLPTGSITIAAGQTQGTITIDVPEGALGVMPSEVVSLQISTPSLHHSVRAEGAHHQWREVPRGELSIAPVADERSSWVTGLAEAS